MNTSVWEALDVEQKVLDVLSSVPLNNKAHPFGRPYMTAYQLAIKLDEKYPKVRQQLGYPLGGSGGGSRNSLAQYLAKQLSDRIRDNGSSYPVEGAFLSDINVTSINYEAHDGSRVESSLTGTGFDLSMFRLA